MAKKLILKPTHAKKNAIETKNSYQQGQFWGNL
jgi:hypothetical protein